MINRLIEPTSGVVLIDGQDSSSIAPHILRRQIGYAFQRVGLFPHMSVGENIAIPLTLEGRDPARIARRVDELLELVELAPGITADRRPTELSGGQKQRVGVARALAAAPRLMLLDEPFGALDPLTRDRLQQSFLRIRKQLAITAVFVTHDMAEALLMGDRIGVMREGRLIQIGTPHELMHAPADDYVQQLIETPMRQASVVDALLGTGPA
jgi:osmoprotectant transport system ATP-binding protein